MSLTYEYVAGMIDSDGCIGTRVVNHCWPFISFGQVRPEAVIEIHKKFGGFVMAPERRKPNSRRLLRLVLPAEDSKKCLENIVKHLRIKRPQAEAVLQGLGNDLHIKEDRVTALREFLRLEKNKIIDVDAFPWCGSGARTFPCEERMPKQCAQFGCDQIAKIKTYCKKHYERHRENGTVPDVDLFRPRLAEPFDYIRNPLLEEIGYLAGCFDGDGNFKVKPNVISARIQQVTPEAVLLAREIYGGGLYKAIRTVEDENGNKKEKKPVVDWTISRQNQVRSFIQDVRPFLLEKKLEADLLMQWSSKMPKREYAALAKEINRHRKEEISEAQIKMWKEYGIIGKPQKSCCKAELDGVICDRPNTVAFDLCSMHYKRLTLYGDPCLVKRQTSWRTWTLVQEL